MGANVGKSGNTFLDTLPLQGTMHVVMLGLDSAGKTTVLYRLKFDQYLNTVPTIGFNCEKVQGTVGKAKGVQFLIWDVGGQEKLRPLWRSYTRCTDGILFVVDSVDFERMEEAKMELMRTVKCSDNQGVPVLILANKQDLPGAHDSKNLERYLGLNELISLPLHIMQTKTTTKPATSVDCCKNKTNCGSSLYHSQYNTAGTSTTRKPLSYSIAVSCTSISKDLKKQNSTSSLERLSSKSLFENNINTRNEKLQTSQDLTFSSVAPSTELTTPGSSIFSKTNTSNNSQEEHLFQYKGWFIQPACAITGEGLQEGLEALYEMILKRRKLNKNKKKR